MAPTPVESATPKPTSTTAASEKTWTTASIVGVSIFGAFVLLFALILTAFLIHRRRELNKLPPCHRPTAYHPFRTESSKDRLLAHATPTPAENCKSSMFSRESLQSSVSLYIDHDTPEKRGSFETSSLIPLHVNPVEGSHGEDGTDSVATTSVGSGTSRNSSNFSSTSSGGSLGLSRIPVPGQELLRPAGTRRKSSATSTRYYDINVSDAPDAPQIPKIVHSWSP